MNIQMIVVNDKKEKLDISDLVSKVTISGDYTQGARKLNCSYAASIIDKTIPFADIQPFNFMYFYQDNKLVFMGTIYELGKDSSNNLMTFYAYDEGVRTLKAKATYNFVDTSIDTIVNTIVKDFSIPFDSAVKSNLKVTKIFFGQTLYDIFMSVYTLLSIETKKKYMLEWTTEGKLKIVEKGIITLDVTFEEGCNLMNSSYTINLDNIINRVAICDENYNYIKDVRDEDTIKLYGIFQDIVKQSEGKDATEEAKSKLKGVEKTCSLSGFGDYTCITGRGVTVKDSYTGLIGLFYIDSDKHTWDKGVYSIDLGLNFKNIMNEMDKSEAEKKESTESGSSGSTVTGGKEVDAEFTAYYPSNDPLQGGYKAANGETLKPSSLTCAAPKEVAFNTKIQVKGTGTSRDGIVYRKNDVGGAINIVNGVYKIDLLMANKKEAYDFGRRKGKAIIGVEVTQNTSGTSGNDGTTSSKAKSAVSFASTKVGGPYVWGGNGPKGYDCSGLTMAAYKSVGISIPRTSKEQSTFGKSISKENLQVGDLLFFCTNGSGSVSHVGIYEGNGVMIHASSPKNGIKRDKLNSNYYFKSGIWKGARRVV